MPMSPMTTKKSDLQSKYLPKTFFKTIASQSLLWSLLVIVMVWWFLSKQVDNALILPKLSVVLSKMTEIGGSEDFLKVIGNTLKHVLFGFSLAFVISVPLGIWAGKSPVAQLFLYPWIQLLRAVPVMSIILYLLLFVPTEWVSVWVAFLIVFPMLFTNIAEGVKAIDPKLLEMAQLYEMPLATQIRHIYIPSLFPYLMAASLTAMGMNVKAVITAEAMSVPEFSIGTQLLEARNYLETETILAWTLWIILIAIVMDVLLLSLKWSVTKGRRAYVIYRRSS